MEKCYKRSFSYMFSAKNWRKEAGILLGILFIINLFTSTIILDMITNFKDLKHSMFVGQHFAISLVSSVLGILGIFICGYLTKCTHSVIKNEDGTLENLPKWSENFFSNFILGAKRYGAVMAVLTLLFPTFIFLGIPFLIFLLIQIPLNRIFCEDFHFDSYIKWGKAFHLIGNNFCLYLGILLTGIFFTIICITIAILLFWLRLPAFITALIISAFEVYTSFTVAFLNGIIGTPKEKAEII